MGAKINERLQIEVELRRALKLGEFELYYQPQIQLATGAVVGVEALIRWRRPGSGLVLPGKFIAVAEETGLIMGIGEWALRKACETRKVWEADGIARFPIAVNISPIQLRQPDFIETLSMTLAQTGLDPALLELEITEGMVMNKTESMIGRLHDVSALGVSLSVDDFGTGYSNLGYLASFPLSKIKIDRSFVSNLHVDPRAASITRAIIALARGLGLGVIAEGVEKPEQAERLEEIGCEHAQGYLFSRPLDATSFAIWLENNSRRSTDAPLLRAGNAYDDSNRKALVP
jgi:EAL domain-containing protein (putative c-di-GMP-specific phosphodiesterase class I)